MLGVEAGGWGCRGSADGQSWSAPRAACTAAKVDNNLALHQVSQLHRIPAPETEVSARGSAKRAIGCGIAHHLALLNADATGLLPFGDCGVGITHHPALAVLRIWGSARVVAAAA